MRQYITALKRDAREVLAGCKPNDVLTHVALSAGSEREWLPRCR